MAQYNVSKREAREQGIKRVKIGGGGGSSSGGSSGGSGGFDLSGFANQIGQATNKYWDFASQVQSLPVMLKDAFRKNRSPELDNQINKAETDYGNAGFEGLSKYSNITDPIARRALAEKYQGLRGTDYKNLLSERDRRQGKYADYIEKYSSLYSAEASRQLGLLNSMKDQWNMQNTLSQQQNSEKWRQMEWDNKMSQQARANARSNKNLSDREMNMKIAQMKEEGKNWEEIVNTLNTDYGISTETAGTLDRSMHDAFGVQYPDDWSRSGFVQPSKTTVADKKYEDELAQQDTIIAQMMNEQHISYPEALKRYNSGNF
jgi:hypothetical protein